MTVVDRLRSLAGYPAVALVRVTLSDAAAQVYLRGTATRLLHLD